jgi:ABC-2 type transport system permease protein
MTLIARRRRGAATPINRRRVKAVCRKELLEYRRNGNVVYAMVIFPLVFLIQPVVSIFTLPSSASRAVGHEHSLIYMLAIPALIPATLAAYAIVGERVQGSLEPVLSTPVTPRELLFGKALAAFMPSVVIAYLVFGLFIAVVELFAHPGIAHALIKGPDVIAQAVFTPLLALWSIWIGMAVSARTSDPRTAAQLSTVVSLPTVAVTSLMAFNVIPITTKVALAFGIGLLVLNRLGLVVAAALFDREKLITSTK